MNERSRQVGVMTGEYDEYKTRWSRRGLWHQFWWLLLFLDTLKDTQELDSVSCVANPIMAESETNTLCHPENLTPCPDGSAEAKN